MDERSDIRERHGLRRPWLRSDRPIPRLIARPLEEFLRLEAGSASLLLAAAVAALVWSNVNAESYERFWSTDVSLELGPLVLEEDLRGVVNDLLMAVFFFVIALEVKREIVFGSLRKRETAAVPAAAALGTMLGAAAVYIAINLDGGDLSGWAVPIATDIAFVLGVLGLVGSRIPAELRAFLLTLAVVDDIATIAVIALFFSTGISVAWLGAAVGVALVILVLRRLGVRLLVPYVLLAGLLWLAVFESNVHATIAGVVLGFLTPARAFHSRQKTAEAIGERLIELAEADDEISEGTMWEVSRIAREAVSPLARMEHLLHPWSAYVILPLFALANAGVPLSPGAIGDALTGQVGLGIMLGLVVGAPLGGIVVASALVRFGPARLPTRLDWAAIGGAAPLKGIGFTVAIFISLLAFEDERVQQEAKLAILIGSAVAGTIGLIALLVRDLFLDGDSEVAGDARRR